MAGIGFELKKLFRRKGLLAGLRAYGCAGILCTGPMLLGVLLQLGILVLCGWAGAAKTEQDLLVCMVTDTLLASLTVMNTVAHGSALVLDARLAALAVAALALWLRTPFLLVVVSGAAAAAAVRWWG